MLAPGEVVDGHAIVAELGRGGAATTYVARRASDGAPVALKVLHEKRASDRRYVEMLVDELRILAHVRHPNVARALDAGVHREAPYLVLEYVHGVSLRELLRALGELGHRLAPTLAAWIAQEIARALAAVHDARDDRGEPLRVVHRDVNPGNVMLSATGEVKLVDFGIARAEGRLHATEKGRVKGTPRYIAPEQLAGGPIDGRADVFSLGSVLWEMLAMRRIGWRGQKVDPPSRFSSDVPPELDRVALRALEWDREARQATAAELAADLEGAIGAEPVDAGALARVLDRTVPDLLLAREAKLPLELSEPLHAARASVASIVPQVESDFTRPAPRVRFDDGHSESSEAETRRELAGDLAEARAADTARRTDGLLRPSAPELPHPHERRARSLGIAVLVALAATCAAVGFALTRLW